MSEMRNWVEKNRTELIEHAVKNHMTDATEHDLRWIAKAALKMSSITAPLHEAVDVLRTVLPGELLPR